MTNQTVIAFAGNDDEGDAMYSVTFPDGESFGTYDLEDAKRGAQDYEAQTGVGYVIAASVIGW